jgi:hypothetical protein
MPSLLVIAYGALLIPLAVIITYYDVRYRRIPNAFVIATLTSGLVVNSIFGGLQGALLSLGRGVQLPGDPGDPLDVVEARGAVEILIERAEERFQHQAQIAINFRARSMDCPILKPNLFDSVHPGRWRDSV